MAIKSLKDKISNLASGEILGETDKEREENAKKERSPKPRKERPKKEKKPKAERPKRERPKRERPKREKVKKEKPARKPKQSMGDFFKRKDKEIEVEEENIIHEDVSESKETEPIVKDSVEGYEDVLSILGIKENLNPEADFQSSDLDYIEFSQTTPLGFDFQEVTDFISRVKYTLNKYENALEQRNKDLIVVASEVKKVEQRMVEANQAKELERMVGGMTEEERLIEENLDLSIEVNDLKNKLIASGRDGDIAKLRKQVEMLSAENDMLKSGIFPANDSEENEGLPSLNNSIHEEKSNAENNFNRMPELSNHEETLDVSNEMPNLSEIEKESDPLDDMISDLGGMYDEER